LILQKHKNLEKNIAEKQKGDEEDSVEAEDKCIFDLCKHDAKH
jgi:hypothetical protein